MKKEFLDGMTPDEIVATFKFYWKTAKVSSYTDKDMMNNEHLKNLVELYNTFDDDIKMRIFIELLALDETGMLDDLSTERKQEVSVINYKEQIKTKHYAIRLFLSVVVLTLAIYLILFRVEVAVFLSNHILPLASLDPLAWTNFWDWIMSEPKK